MAESPHEELARKERERQHRARQLLRTAGSNPEALAYGWAEAEQRAVRAEIDLTKPPGERKYCAGCSLPGLMGSKTNRPYVLTWMQKITLDVDRPPWYQRIFGYKKTTSRWVKFGIKLKGIDEKEFALAFEMNGLYDSVCLERKETPTVYVAGATTHMSINPQFEDNALGWTVPGGDVDGK